MGIHWQKLAPLCVAMALCGCRAANRPALKTDAAAPTLSIITPHNEDIRAEFGRAFTDAAQAAHPGLRLHWIAPGGTGDALDYVRRAAADKTSAGDVFFGGGAETFGELETAGLLQKLPSDYGVPPELNGVPLRSYDGKWTAAALSSFGILVNRQAANRARVPLPASWGDLARPVYRNRLALVDPRRSASAHAIYENILQLYGWQRGWQILGGMARNASAFETSSGRAPHLVAQGRALAAPTVHFLARAEMDAHSGLSYLEPARQRIITPDPIGILRGSTQPILAQEFVAFVLSERGQKLWMLRRGTPGGPRKTSLHRLAVLPSLYHPIPNGSLTQNDPYDLRNVRPYDAVRASRRPALLDDLFGAILVDNHALLSRRATTFVPISESQADALSTRWRDAAFRDAHGRSWRASARAFLQSH